VQHGKQMSGVLTTGGLLAIDPSLMTSVSIEHAGCNQDEKNKLLNHVLNHLDVCELTILDVDKRVCQAVRDALLSATDYGVERITALSLTLCTIATSSVCIIFICTRFMERTRPNDYEQTEESASLVSLWLPTWAVAVAGLTAAKSMHVKEMVVGHLRRLGIMLVAFVCCVLILAGVTWLATLGLGLIDKNNDVSFYLSTRLCAVMIEFLLVFRAVGVLMLSCFFLALLPCVILSLCSHSGALPNWSTYICIGPLWARDVHVFSTALIGMACNVLFSRVVTVNRWSHHHTTRGHFAEAIYLVAAAPSATLMVLAVWRRYCNDREDEGSSSSSSSSSSMSDVLTEAGL